MKMILTYTLARLRNEACIIYAKLFNFSLGVLWILRYFMPSKSKARNFHSSVRTRVLIAKVNVLAHLIRVRENYIGNVFGKLVRITLRDLTNYVLIFKSIFPAMLEASGSFQTRCIDHAER